jgi:hypothetical protein
MVRRTTLDRDTSWSAEDDALPPDPAPSRTRSAGRQWGGSGGRWFVWTLRVVAWLVLLLIGYRGVTAIVTGQTTSGTSAPAASRGTGFPVTLAQAYALSFGNVYLNYGPATAAQRARSLASFLPAGADPQLGYNGQGSQHLQSEQVASVSVHGAHNAIVTLLAEVNNKLIELGVPIYASGGAMVVTGEPALLAPPARAVPPEASTGSSDQTTASVLQGQLPPFFRAYASGDQATLSRFLASGAQVSGLDGAATFGSIQSVTVPFGGSTRQITVVVNWSIDSSGVGKHAPPVATAPATVSMTYQMTVVRQGTSWYVQSIGASPESPGPP